MASRETAPPVATRPLRLRLRGSLDDDGSEPEFEDDESAEPDATPDVRAVAEDELPLFDEDDDPRGTALPLRDPSGGGVRTCSTGGGGGSGAGAGAGDASEDPP